MKKIFVLLALVIPSLCFSQDAGLVYYDYVYLDNIKSVKFHADGLLLSIPSMELGSNVGLELGFDELSDEIKDYVFTVQHCDANWKPSGLSEMEYIDGYSESQVRKYDYSFKVKSVYTHYWLSLPNEDFKLILSGNYLLKVYEDEDKKRLAITRRFMVVDNRVSVEAKTSRTARVDKMRTHQEIDFTINHESYEIRNPQQELTAVVLQNGRWDTAITGLKPMFSRLGQQIFDYQDKVVFPGGQEFRYLDLRGVRYPSPRITVTEMDGKYEAVLEKDVKRSNRPYLDWRDINGNFIIENGDERNRLRSNNQNNATAGNFVTRLNDDEEQDFSARIAQAQSTEERVRLQNQRLSLLSQRQQEANSRELQLYGNDSFVEDVHNLQSEYVDVFFQLYSPGEMYEQDVYIFGGLTDWQFKPAFKMTYNPAVNGYVGKVSLKQGYYDYVYAALPKGATKPDFEETEGDSNETENNYTILLYFRQFGMRFDQLIGAYSFSSRQQ